MSISASLNATSAFLADALESATIGLSGLGLVRSTAGASDEGLEVFVADVGYKVFVTFLVGFFTMRVVWFLQDMKVCHRVS